MKAFVLGHPSRRTQEGLRAPRDEVPNIHKLSHSVGKAKSVLIDGGD
jgi:hypothetical protein